MVFSPPLLLLDEMNAHLDSLTEKKVLSALERVSSERTVLSISHRLEISGLGRILWIGPKSGPGSEGSESSESSEGGGGALSGAN